MHAHRPLPDDSDLRRAVTVLARAQADSLWNRQQLANQLRSLLREYYPAALAAFATWIQGLCQPEARELLKTAPTPPGAQLARTQFQSALKRADRQRGPRPRPSVSARSSEASGPDQPALVEDALGNQMLALLIQLDAACIAADSLAEAVEETFPQRSDTKILLSFPGLGLQLAARALAARCPCRSGARCSHCSSSPRPEARRGSRGAGQDWPGNRRRTPYELPGRVLREPGGSGAGGRCG
nr:hypothetical protein StreXyl84_63410 [Streptomyces sp. Xyl84]